MGALRSELPYDSYATEYGKLGVPIGKLIVPLIDIKNAYQFFLLLSKGLILCSKSEESFYLGTYLPVLPKIVHKCIADIGF